MAKWGMVIELGRCIGCRSCTVACKEANGVPQHALRQVLDLGLVEDSCGQRFFLAIQCNHCQDPPCLAVCPTGATFKRDDGIVAIDGARCMGCGYCIVACPYRARTIVHAEAGFGRVDHDPAERGKVRTGICLKCDFCATRIDEGMRKGLRPGLDPEATPACVTTCSAGALSFGDLDNPESEVSRKIGGKATVRLQEDLGTGPSIHYSVPSGWRSLIKEG